MKETGSMLLVAFFVIAFSLVSPAFAGEAGKKIFMDYECQSCHAISAYGISIVKSEDEEEDDDYGEEEAIEPPDLSNVGSKRDKKFLSLFLRKKVAIDGRKHKKRFKGTKEERRELVIWLSTLTKPAVTAGEGKAK